jgi:hypothetical protein
MSYALDVSDSEEIFPNPSQELSQTYLEVLTATQDRVEISKTSVKMETLLRDYKYTRPAIFRQYLRISPFCFDALVARITDDPVFSNNSNNSQLPVETQLAVALYRFGHYGNGASILEVAEIRIHIKCEISRETSTVIAPSMIACVLFLEFNGAPGLLVRWR